MELKPTAFVAEAELVEALSIRAIPVSCDADRVLFRQGDAPEALYILKEGVATLAMDSHDGKPILSIKTTAGSLLGLPGLVGNQPYTLTATAHAGAKVSSISSGDFAALMQADPSLALKILQVLAAEVRSARVRFLNTFTNRPPAPPAA